MEFLSTFNQLSQQQPQSALRISLHGPSATASRVLHQTFCNSYCWRHENLDTSTQTGWLTPLMLCVTQQWFCQMYINSYINMLLLHTPINCNKHQPKLFAVHPLYCFTNGSSQCVVKDPCHIRWLMWPPGRLGTAGISGPLLGRNVDYTHHCFKRILNHKKRYSDIWYKGSHHHTIAQKVGTL